MRRSRGSRQAVAILVAVTFGFLCIFVAPLQAAMVGTSEILKSGSHNLDRQTVEQFLERKDVVKHLKMLGVTPAEAKARVSAMTDEEVSQLAKKINQMPAGGDAIGFLLALILVGFIVLVITDIAGVTDVFTFIKKR